MSAGAAARVSGNLQAIVRIQAFVQGRSLDIPHLSEPVQEASGTGFIIHIQHEAGGVRHLTIMTAAHVLQGAIRFTVRFPMLGRGETRGRLLTFVPEFDLAVFMVTLDPRTTKGAEGLQLRALRLATDAEINGLEQGEAVQAYGFPNGLKAPKVSSGVFNGVERHELMHDAATSPGSSGGPLLAARLDKVIGVVSWKIVSRGSEGSQFTMPVSLWHGVRSRIAPPRARPQVLRRPLFGFCVQAVTDKRTMERLCGADTGCSGGGVLMAVAEGSPMWEAGARAGDLLTSFDGHALTRYAEARDVDWARGQYVAIQELLFRAAELRPYRMTLRRNGVAHAITVDVTPVEPRGSLCTLYPPLDTIDFVTLDGLVCETSSKELVKSTALDRKKVGELLGNTFVVIVHVLRGTRAAEESAFRPGMVIETVQGRAVHTAEEVMRILKAGEGGGGSKDLEICGGNIDYTITYTTTRENVAENWSWMREHGMHPFTATS